MSVRTATLEFHPASQIFPLLGDDELQALADDIRENGLIEPIMLDADGRIVDGRNRKAACTLAGIEPRYATLPDGVSPVSYVISVNLHRRHLTKSQAAIAAAEAEPLFAEYAKKRQREHGGTAPGKNKDTQSKNGLSDLPRRASDDAGELFGVGRQYVSDAKSLMQESPDLAEKVKNKELTLQDAKRELKNERQQKQASEKPWPKRERELQRRVKAGETVVANVDADSHLVSWARQQNLLVMVDRSSPWGNPFLLDKDGDRPSVCRKYAEHYLPHKDSLQAMLPTLKGKVLACHCAPRQCHADAIAEAVNAT